VLTKAEEYRREAQRVHNRAACAKISQEKEMLREIERAFERLVALEEWLEACRKKDDCLAAHDAIAA